MDECLLCGSESSHHVDFEVHTDHGVEIKYQQCKRCGLVFQKQPLSGDELENFYRDDYRTLVQGQEEPSNKDRWVQGARANMVVEYLKAHLPKVNRHLDIGSSSGDLLLAVSEAFGCYSLGVEPGDAYRAFSESMGANVVSSLDELDPSMKNQFELITISHVLEHLPAPIPYLKKIRSNWLTDDGMLYIEVPNLYGHPALEVSHITVYCLNTLTRMLETSGFKIVDHKTHGKPYSRLLRLFITVLAVPSTIPRGRDYPKPNLPWMRFRRKTGLSMLYGARAVSSRVLRKGQLEPWSDS